MNIITGIIELFIGSKTKRDIAEITPYVEKVKSAYETVKKLSNDQLRELTQDLRKRIKEYVKDEKSQIEAIKTELDDNETLSIEEREVKFNEIDELEKTIVNKYKIILDEILPEAFAVIKDTARRFYENPTIEVTATDFDRDLAATKDFVEIKGDTAIYKNQWLAGGNLQKWEMVHYDVQLFGGVALHKGKIAEMATGEGKTLVATLPVFLNALTGLGVHVVTVNDYLAKRDSEWMGPLYMFNGLSVDCIDKHQPHSENRRKAYECDITFGTNNEFGFDYLRDNMVSNPEELVQRKHNFAIVDEVDSVLIDDARTPLIISGPVPKGDDQLYNEFKPVIERLYNAQRNLANQIFTEARKLITDGNNEEGGKLLLRVHKGLPKYKPLIKFLSEQGTKALMLKTENFYMAENNKNMHIVTDELYFVIDEKNHSIELTDKGIDFLSNLASDSKFFVLPDVGSELAEIEKSISDPDKKLIEKDRIMQDFALKSDRVHTVNQLLKAYTLFEKDVEYVIMDNKIKIVDEQTGRIMEGRRYSDGLHQAIEAKENVKVEAATQTFATITLQNYFRMYQKLAGMTGTAETEAGELWNIYKLDVVVIPTNKPIVRNDQNDLVYKTKREKYVAVIDEIAKLREQNRPTLVGTTSVEVSELLSRMLKLRGINHNVLNAKLHQREADIVAEAGRAKTVTIATNMAGRGTDIKLTPEVKEAGGLAIIGTERHESRRVDRQLRGRSGRQGDPGSSQFFVSLEDDLMRLFGSDRIARMMDRMGLKEGEVIQHSMITKSIERAQKKVEENHFGVRKRLLEYDDVMNSQREVIYKKRRNALFGDRIQIDVAQMMSSICEEFVENNVGSVDYHTFKNEMMRLLAIEPPFDEKHYLKAEPDEVFEVIHTAVLEKYKRKEEFIAKQIFPFIKDIYERQGSQFKNIAIPITDGYRVYQVVVNLEKAYKTKGTEAMRAIEKSITLWLIDENWKENLREMDDLKQSVQNATYEQKDPLLIYKFESFELFKKLVNKISQEVITILLRAFIPQQNPENIREAERRKTDLSQMQTQRSDLARIGPTGPVRAEPKVGRNEPCPCGSGKKYKHCHGK